MPIIDLSQTPFLHNFDVHNGQGSKFKGKIEEVKFYNYTLSQTEVREKMHLISDPFTETGLIKYFQYNQYDPTSGSLYDVRSNFNSFVPAANIVTSTAPVSTGRVFRNPAVTTGGLNSFPAAGVNLHLPTTGTYPNGEVVAFHLFSNPDTKPDFRPTVPGYFIINNYGANASFTQPDSVTLSQLNVSYSGYNAGDFRLFKRATGDFGNTWSAELDSAATFQYALSGSALTYTANGYDTVFNSQYLLVNNDTTNYTTTTPVRTGTYCSISDLYPNPTREWTKVNITVPDGITPKITCAITDIKGTQVLRFTQQLSTGTNTIMMHLPPLAAGTYLVSISLPGQHTTIRKLLIH
jgi:hypothetical protein